MSEGTTSTYRIASKTFAVRYGVGLASKVLEKELSLYEKTTAKPDVSVGINDRRRTFTVLSRNPLIHEELENGFRCHFGQATVAWIKQHDGLYVNLVFDENKRSLLRKFRNMQYTHPFEGVGQIFHELVVFPTLFFFPHELTLLHGSALETEHRKAVVIGGTGGVGKTGLELFLISKGNLRFLADDITFIDRNGYVWPNFAFPKIYGYNVVGDESAEKKVLENRGVIDRIQWHLRKTVSTYRVRRRVNPYIFYDGHVGIGSRISRFCFLFRGRYDDFSAENVTADDAAAINLEIMKSEYTVFLKHLLWHKVNRLLLQTKTIIDIDSVLREWYQLQKRILKTCRCYVVKVPLKSDLLELTKWFVPLLA